jgi:hypothetical protein
MIGPGQVAEFSEQSKDGRRGIPNRELSAEAPADLENRYARVAERLYYGVRLDLYSRKEDIQYIQ